MTQRCFLHPRNPKKSPPAAHRRIGPQGPAAQLCVYRGRGAGAVGAWEGGCGGRVVEGGQGGVGRGRPCSIATRTCRKCSSGCVLNNCGGTNSRRACVRACVRARAQLYRHVAIALPFTLWAVHPRNPFAWPVLPWARQLVWCPRQAVWSPPAAASSTSLPPPLRFAACLAPSSCYCGGAPSAADKTPQNRNVATSAGHLVVPIAAHMGSPYPGSAPTIHTIESMESSHHHEHMSGNRGEQRKLRWWGTPLDAA